MKFHRFLTYACFLGIVCCLSVGCGRINLPPMFAIDDARIPEDPGKYLPEIMPSPTLAAGKFRIRVSNLKVSNSKVVQIHSIMGDIDERVKVICSPEPCAVSKNPQL